MFQSASARIASASSQEKIDEPTRKFFRLPGNAVNALLVKLPAHKFQLQRSGYATAFSDSRVIEAIRSGPNGRIAVELVEWSGPLSQNIVIDWMVISDDKTARLFGDHIVEASRAFADSTSISAGIDFAMTQLDRAPYETRRRVIDVSGDGDSNSGRDVTAARDEAIAKGVTINGLVILTEMPSPWNSTHTNPPGGLANYYRNNVIGGPGAFVMVAENSNSFGDIIGTSGERADAPKGSSSRRSNTNPTNEFVRRQLIRVVLSPAVFDRDIQPHPERGFRTCLGILRLYRGIVGFGAS